MQCHRPFLWLGGLGLAVWLATSVPAFAGQAAPAPDQGAEPTPWRVSEAASPDRPMRLFLRDREDWSDRAPKPDRPGPSPDSEDHDRPPPRELSPEQIQAALEILQEQNPELARRLRQALDKQPELARRLLANQWPRLQRLIDLKKNHPGIFRLTIEEFRRQREMLETARRLRQASDPRQQAELREGLRAQVRKLFDLRLELHRRELELLEKRVEEMRENLRQAQEQRDARIDQQLDELENSKRPLRPVPPGQEP